MAVELVGASVEHNGGSATSITKSMTVDAGANYLLVGIAARGSGESNPAVTFNSISLVSLESSRNDVRLFGLGSPDITTANIVFSSDGANSKILNAQALSGVDLGNPTKNTGGNASNPITAILAAASPGDMHWSMARQNWSSGNLTSTGEQTNVEDTIQSNVSGAMGYSDADGTTMVHSYTDVGGNGWISYLALRAQSSGGSPIFWYFNRWKRWNELLRPPNYGELMPEAI